jgi:hypothetical protein
LTAVDRPPPPPDDIGPALLAAGAGGGPGLAAGGGLTERLERWAADARVDEAARARSRERWLRRQAEEERTLAGVLADLLEARAVATVQTVAPGASFAGVVRALGADFVALGAEGRQAGEVVVALAAVASVGTRAGSPEVLGDRRALGTMRLADVVAELAAGRDEVRVVTRDGGTLAGTVASVGQDVVVVRSAGPRPATTYVPVDAVVAVAVDG